MSERVGPPHPDVLEEEIDDEVLLLDARSGKYFSLNRTAADVWRLSDGEMTEDEMVTALAAAYEVAAGSIVAEVSRAIGGFVEAGLFDQPDA